MSEERTNITIPSLEEFLHAGSHFGHRSSRWNPKMKQYIYAERQGVHIIDLVKTMKLLKNALEAIQTNADKGSVLLVGTKGQAASMVQKIAEEKGAFYVNTRWPGGLFTNHKMIIKSVSKLINMEEELANGAEGLVKKEQLLLEREVARLNKLYEGIKFMDRLPSLIIVIDSKLEKNAINEARNVGIPIVAMMDTNCDPDLVDYPIPSNDDSIKSIKLFLDLFGQAIGSGKRSTRVISLRQSHKAKLEQLRHDYEHKVEVEQMELEAERERMRKLRGKEERVTVTTRTKPVVRVTKKEEVIAEDKGKKNVTSESDQKTVVVKSTKKAVKTVSTKEVAKKATVKTKAQSDAKSSEVKAVKSVSKLELSKRTQKALDVAGIKDLAELAGRSDDELKQIKGIGEASVKEIKNLLK